MKQPTTQQSTRRTVLRTLGVGGLTVGFAGVGTAQPDYNRSRRNDTPQGDADSAETQPDDDFECPDGMEPLGTFEFVTIEDDDGELLDCYFLQEGGEYYITITGYESKEGEDCEPIDVYYESDSHEIGQVASFGGQDIHIDEEPEDGIYESDLENNGGQQAAISLLHFCGTERERLPDSAEADGEANETAGSTD